MQQKTSIVAQKNLFCTLKGNADVARSLRMASSCTVTLNDLATQWCDLSIFVLSTTSLVIKYAQLFKNGRYKLFDFFHINPCSMCGKLAKLLNPFRITSLYALAVNLAFCSNHKVTKLSGEPSNRLRSAAAERLADFTGRDIHIWNFVLIFPIIKRSTHALLLTHLSSYIYYKHWYLPHPSLQPPPSLAR